MIKKIFLTLMAICSYLSVGVVPIILERQAYYAEEEVKEWKKSTCLMKDLSFHYEYFTFTCSYEIAGKNYLVRRETAVWNQYFDNLRMKDERIEVFIRNNHGEKENYSFKKGDQTEFWYDPKDPSFSVLMKSSGSLREFLYFSIGVNLIIAVMIYFGFRAKPK